MKKYLTLKDVGIVGALTPFFASTNPKGNYIMRQDTLIYFI